MSVRRLLSNISSDRLQESRDFYADLLGMEVAFESDWYIRLHSPTNPGLELGIIQRDHPLLPADWRAVPVGMYLTFVVDNVDDIHARAVVRGLPIVQPPRDEFYGQRRHAGGHQLAVAPGSHAGRASAGGDCPAGTAPGGRAFRPDGAQHRAPCAAPAHHRSGAARFTHDAVARRQLMFPDRTVGNGNTLSARYPGLRAFLCH